MQIKLPKRGQSLVRHWPVHTDGHTGVMDDSLGRLLICTLRVMISVSVESILSYKQEEKGSYIIALSYYLK